MRSDGGGAYGRAGVRYRDLHGKAECVQSRALWVRTPEEDAPSPLWHSTALSQERRGETRECSPNQPNQTAYGSTGTSPTVSDMRACGQKAEVQDIGTNPTVRGACQTHPPAPTGEVWNKQLELTKGRITPVTRKEVILHISEESHARAMAHQSRLTF